MFVIVVCLNPMLLCVTDKSMKLNSPKKIGYQLRNVFRMLMSISLLLILVKESNGYANLVIEFYQKETFPHDLCY